MIRRYCAYSFLLLGSTCGLLSLQSLALTVDFKGLSKKVIKVDADKNTGLTAIYVAQNTADITEMEISDFGGTADEVKVYSSLGGGYAEDIPFSRNGTKIVIQSPAGNRGYIVSTDKGNTCFWLTDYSSYPLNLYNVTLDSEQECENTRIKIEGSGEEILYYTIDGRVKVLERDIHLDYTTLEWSEEDETFVPYLKEKFVNSIEGVVSLSPPFYCNTSVIVSGDRFLKEWGEERRFESGLFSPTAVSVMSTATQTISGSEEDGSNIIGSGESELGGSAPADISFKGFITDAVLHTEWQMASDSEFEYILYRFNQQDVDYSFTQEGQYYMRFIGSNHDGSCESIGDTYTISIGASDLRIPNAFSPNNDGVNDVWKVGYRSLLDFKCWIFDSKGNQLFYFDDPSSGWDGKYHGKVVRPGVYYYVIQATGADGKKYKNSGDINIINYKKYGESTGSVEE